MPNFPRNIRLDQETEAKLISYLNEQLTIHRSERGKWVKELENWQVDYYAEPLEEIKSFPFRGACNLIIPLTAIAVETVHAREITTIFALDEFVTLKLPEQISDVTTQLERAIDTIAIKDCDIERFADQALLENKKFGTSIGKCGYERIVKNAIREVDGQEVPFQVITRQGPCCDAVSLPRFIMPFTAIDPQKAPWCGEEHIKTPYEVKQLVDSGFFYPELWEKLQNFIDTGQGLTISSAEYIQKVQQMQKQVPVQWPREITWHEVQLAFNVDNNNEGKEYEIVVHYHMPTQTLFSVRYNWYKDLRRSYRICNYFPVEHRWAGIGIGKQNEQFQMEITTLERQRIDNATLANMRMYKVKQGIGYGPDEPVFPGKIWMVEEADDVSEIVMTEVYASSFNNSAQVSLWSNQRTGVTEVTQGLPAAGTPDTATGSLSKVQESARKFDYTYRHSKKFILDITSDLILIANQYGVRDRRMFDMIPQGQIVEQLLMNPDQDLLKLMILDNMKLAGANSNKMVDRNTWTQLAGISQQYFSGMFQLAPAFGPQISQQMAVKAMMAATEIMKQIYESFDVRSIDKLLFNFNQNVLSSQLSGGQLLPGSSVPSETTTVPSG